MKYEIITSNRFKKDLKRCHKRGLDMKLIYEVMYILGNTGTLPMEYRPHKLNGKHAGQWECHIQPDIVYTHHEINTRNLSLIVHIFTIPSIKCRIWCGLDVRCSVG